MVSDFIGPCAHGRDPYERCDVCVELTPGEAEVIALKEELRLARAEIRRWEESFDQASADRTSTNQVHWKLRNELEEARVERDRLREALRRSGFDLRLVAENLKGARAELEQARAECAALKAACLDVARAAFAEYGSTAIAIEEIDPGPIGREYAERVARLVEASDEARIFIRGRRDEPISGNEPDPREFLPDLEAALKEFGA